MGTAGCVLANNNNNNNYVRETKTGVTSAVEAHADTPEHEYKRK